jgi:RNA polymerase sigma-70 factor (ECF subfamily)
MFDGFAGHTGEDMSHESDVIQQAAAEFIRQRHHLGAFVYGLVRDAHLAEDVLQEVWVRLVAAVGKGTTLENQAAWCRAVARNLVLQHWERQRSAKVVADSALLETFLDRVEEAFAEVDNAPEEWAARQKALDDCVAALSERSRRLLTLKYEARAPMEEIARVLGQSVQAVTKALYRLRRALLECVERKLRELAS